MSIYFKLKYNNIFFNKKRLICKPKYKPKYFYDGSLNVLLKIYLSFKKLDKKKCTFHN